MKAKFLLKNFNKIPNKIFLSNAQQLFSYQKRNIASGATFQTDTTKVKLRGKFLKSRREDMPTLLWFPEILESAENYEHFFINKNHRILDYRNVWLINPRNFAESDHHESFALDEFAEDIARFMEEKRLSIVTVGGHGFGAKVACAFASTHLEKTSGVICVEGGPLDQSFHPAWNSIRDYIKDAYKASNSSSSLNDIARKLDRDIKDKRWNKIFKQNLIESSSGASWKCNLSGLAASANKYSPDFTKWGPQFGLFPGRALIQWASHSNHIHLATNTIPFYNFFPKLEGKFPSMEMNFIQTDEDDSTHWLFDYHNSEVVAKLASRMSNWLALKDGVHVLLNDRNEIGWYGVPERYNKIGDQICFATEYTPEHLHHNWKYTNAYKDSKKARGVEAAGQGVYSKGLSNSKYW